MVKYNNGLTKDPDFFANVYAYFIRGGYFVILVQNILTIITMAFTLGFITFICFFLDWVRIGTCESEATCGNFNDYIVYPTSFHNTSTNVCMFIYITMFFCYWALITKTLIGEIIRYLKYRNYFKMIGIRTSEIKVLTWLDVVDKMIQYDPSLTPEIIVGSIMNKNNYTIAMIGSNLFKINPAYYTETFIWLIDVGILSQIIADSKNTKKIKVDTDKIKYTMWFLATLSVLLLPFSFTIMIVHYIVNITTDIYTKKSYLGPKEWTIYAKLLFREYNELQHIFSLRIAKSYEFASKYEQKFSAHLTNSLMEKTIFTLGACLTLLVILTFYNEALVLYIKLFDRTLIWYITIIVTAITVARMAMVDPASVDESAEEIMEKIAEHTHYFPKHWINKCHTSDVLDEYKSLFKYKLSSIFVEVASIFVIPYYIFFHLPKDIELIAAFIEDNTVYCEGVGHICKAGFTTNLSMYSSTYGGYTNANDYEYELIIEDDKIERSLENFKKYYYRDQNENKLISNKNPNQITNPLINSIANTNIKPIESIGIIQDQQNNKGVFSIGDDTV